MKAFLFDRPRALGEVVRALGEEGDACLLAGGTDLLARMKERIDAPDRVVGLLDLGEAMRGIETRAGGLRIGARVTLAEIAASDAVRETVPHLARAASQAASPQIRNRATLGGNLAQHPRCDYHRHRSFPCWRRGATSCPVLEAGAVQEGAAAFGNDVCASAHPSSLAPALGTADAVLHVVGGQGARTVPFAAFWSPPEAGRATDFLLAPDEVITAVDVAARRSARGWGTSHQEIRRKAAFDWPMVVCAVALQRDAGVVKRASIWLGAVSPHPLRAAAAEAIVGGKSPSPALALRAAEAAAQGATPLPGNAHKVQQVRAAVRRALVEAWS
ncbi:MAG: xanthine dehydrogenase family protein subunit M [Planctomycetota bacterium]